MVDREYLEPDFPVEPSILGRVKTTQKLVAEQGIELRYWSLSLCVKPGPLKLKWASESPEGLVKTQVVQAFP